MRAVIQRVSEASVIIDGREHAAIGKGLLVLAGIEAADSSEDVHWLSGKIASLRIFDDDQGIMNLDIKTTGGDILLVSQFTLHAATKKGKRPSYIRAARPEKARPLYEALIGSLEKEMGKPVGSGVFGADMQLRLLNEGPVTIIIDTRNRE